MQEEKRFFRTVCTLAIPAALQSLLQSSFSLVDQIMIGQLGAVSVAAVGLAGKFASIYTVVIAAIGAVAGIMISQYLGQNAPAEVRRSFFTNLWLGFGLAGAFTALCLLCPGAIMRAYTADAQTLQTAAGYLRLLAGTYLPMAGATMLAAAFRCAEKPRLPLYAGIASALLNTVLNDLLIFGKCGFAAMGATGAGIATIGSQWVNFLLMLLRMHINKIYNYNSANIPQSKLSCNLDSRFTIDLHNSFFQIFTAAVTAAVNVNNSHSFCIINYQITAAAQVYPPVRNSIYFLPQSIVRKNIFLLFMQQNPARCTSWHVLQ